jgi:WD40 repeat protein
VLTRQSLWIWVPSLRLGTRKPGKISERYEQKLGGADSNTERQVGDALRQAVYATNEYNRLSGHKAAVMAVDVSPDSSIIASASVDSTVKLWQRDGTGLATLKGHKGIVRAVKFSSDGEIIASGSDDGTIKLSPQTEAC